VTPKDYPFGPAVGDHILPFYTPGAWIERVAYRSIRSFLHGKMTQTHPQSHSDRHHDSRRRSV
jgi:hypothetical protein